MQCVLVSKEDEEASYLDRKLHGKYCVCFDPLDGSSNIDCGMPIGMVCAQVISPLKRFNGTHN
uniref:Fructose-1-6-bisphosphatase class I N-terminal domain-containing protein n=1 Tax=Triticum urartu TaxID=4572 RepID=A0A8R7TT39_TRIUA